MDFSGKTIIVTGAGGGIGEGYAKACAERGMHVVIAELNEKGGQRVASEINAAGGSALFVPGREVHYRRLTSSSGSPQQFTSSCIADVRHSDQQEDPKT